jgi:succinate dehydrogenase hydrophobic anchor subunit
MLTNGLQKLTDKLINQNPNLQSALHYLCYFALVYLLFICIYSVFYYVYVAKKETEFLSHILWWLKSTGIWFLFGPIILISFSSEKFKKAKLYCLGLGLTLISTAVGLQVFFDYQHLKHDLVGFSVLYLPKQTAIFLVFCLYWYLLCHHKTDKHDHAVSANATNETRQSISVEDKGKTIEIPFNDIQSVTSAGNYIEIKTPQDCYLKRYSLKEVLALLPSNFCQIHRSTIVNIKTISRFDNRTSLVYLSDGEALRISKRCKTQFKQQLSDYPITPN